MVHFGDAGYLEGDFNALLGLLLPYLHRSIDERTDKQIVREFPCPED